MRNLDELIARAEQYPRELMNWGHVVRNTAIAIGITFITAVGVYLAIRFFMSAI